MSDTKKARRLSPPLMAAFREAHRAKDGRAAPEARDGSGRRVLGARNAGRAGITEQQLRGELTRDLNALMNTTNLASAIDLDDHPEVRRSILNHGLPDVVNRTIDENRTDEIVGEIETAILDFEPRIVRNTVQVRRDRSIDAATLAIRFVVKAEMAADPASVPVEFVADLDVASAKMTIRTT